MPKRLKFGRSMEFRVYPESVHSFYFEVEIFSSKIAMHECLSQRAHKEGKTGHGRGYRAIVTGYRMGSEIKGVKYWKKCLGKIWLNQNNIGSEVISHECTHAAFRWAEAAGLDLYEEHPENAKIMKTDCSEERFCYALGRLMSQIVDVCWNEGFYSGRYA